MPHAQGLRAGGLTMPELDIVSFWWGVGCACVGFIICELIVGG